MGRTCCGTHGGVVTSEPFKNRQARGKWKFKARPIVSLVITNTFFMIAPRNGLFFHRREGHSNWNWNWCSIGLVLKSGGGASSLNVAWG